MSPRSINSAKLSGVHLKQSRGLSRPTIAKIFPPILKHRSSPHCSFSVARGKARQNSRMISQFISFSHVSVYRPRQSKLCKEINMQTRTLGNSDLKITPVGYGAWAIGGSGWQFG